MSSSFGAGLHVPKYEADVRSSEYGGWQLTDDESNSDQEAVEEKKEECEPRIPAKPDSSEPDSSKAGFQ